VGRTNLQTFAPAEIVPRSYLEPLDVTRVFGREAPLEVDLGCGDGSFLVSLAARQPERNFIGVERMGGRMRSASRKIGAFGLTNARVVEHDILQAVQQLFAPGSVDVFHLLFPDPWPKRRHGRRRIVTVEFLRGVARALRVGGELRIATDAPDYFRQVQELAGSIPTFVAGGGAAADLTSTTFEERFRRSGLPIHRLTLRKLPSPR